MDMMKEFIWSKLDVKRRTNKRGTDMITGSLMGTFIRTILMRRISSSRMNFIMMVCEYIENVRLSIQLTILIKEYILVLKNRAIDL